MLAHTAAGDHRALRRLQAPRARSRTLPCAIIRHMHVILLRLALGLYSVGLLHSVLTVLKRKHTFFRPALMAVSPAGLPHRLDHSPRYGGSIPSTDPKSRGLFFFAALATIGFLIAYAKYRIASLSVFAFPSIFIMTFIANLFYDPDQSIPDGCEATGFTSIRRWSFSDTRRCSSPSRPPSCICFRNGS